MQSKLNVKVWCNEGAQIPTYGSAGAACFDICAMDVSIADHGQCLLVRTGLHFEIPDGFVLLVYTRSGLAFNKGMQLVNNVAVIDSDYRGELVLKFVKNFTNLETYPDVGMRVAQGMIVPVPAVSFSQVESLDELTSTVRATGGFGSTGV